MRIAALAVLLCSGALPALAVPASSELTLVDHSEEPEFNAIIITVDPGVAADSDTSILSGMVNVLLEIDPIMDQVSEMTVTSGNVTGTGVSFSANLLAASYNIRSTAIGATITTPMPPGVVDPATGVFDGSQHSFTVNSGSLSGSVRIVFDATTIPPNDFSTNPVTGMGAGTGSVSLALASSTATTKTYDVTVLIPVAIDDTFPATDTIDVAVTASGTVKATGTVTVPSTLYGIWTAENAMPDALFGEDEDGDGVANGLQWALGLGADQPARPHLIRGGGSGGLEITLPAGGSAGELTVLASSDPATVPFTPVDPSAVSAGNPIPPGTTGTVTVAATGNSGFLRLQASE